MLYRRDAMPITCGAFNSLPVPYNQGALQSVPQNASVMGMQQQAMPSHTMSPHTMPSHMTPSHMTPSQVMPSSQALPTLPTGVPAGTPSAAAVPTGPAMNGTGQGAQVPVTVESTLFTPGFLRTQIGRRVRVEFLLGTNLLTDRTGTLVAVGASYILIRPVDSDDLMMCDIYSIKFVTIIL